ncbi:MAG: GNAT family N-acetyltransferase [Clostridiales bacterium]
MSKKIRKIENDADIVKIVDLAKIIWIEHYKDILGEDQVKFILERQQSFDSIKNQIKDKGHVYFGIFLKEKLAGYMSIIYEMNSIHLSKIYILKSFRGNNIGTFALNFIKDICVKYNKDKIKLIVHEDNPTIRFYKKLGFRFVKKSVKDYGNGKEMKIFNFEKIIRQ